jgi:4,5-dihydroxyphthalate decarboxylase
LAIRCVEAQALFRSVLREAAWDVAELSMASHIAAVGAGRRDYVGLPVFPSRAFRHPNLYVRTDRIRTPEDLAGRAIGLIDYQQTAALWMRGLLADDHAVDRRSVQWVAGGLHAPVTSDRAPMAPPPGITIRRTPETLDELLRRGEIDAVISPTAPAAFTDPTAPVARMWPDHGTAQQAWWRRTGIFPIMHVIVVRRTLVEAQPDLADRLTAAFDAALTLAQQDIVRRDYPKIALPGLPALIEQSVAGYGPSIWNYGVEANRATLETMLRYAADDGLTAARLSVGELFA